MKELKLSGGASTSNSVAFFLSKIDMGTKATRQADGTIVKEKVHSGEQANLIRQLIMFVLLTGLIRECCFQLNFPMWVYHMPTVILGLFFTISVMMAFGDTEMRKYHGAEHKLSYWYTNTKRENSLESVQKCPRIHVACGSNLIATIVTFQLMSSICMSKYNIHIPEIITAAAPFFTYTIFPINLLGLIAQLITTATPETEHISVATEALVTLIEENV